MNFFLTLKKLSEKKDLSEEEAEFAMQKILQGNISNSNIASFLTALKLKGETVEEIVSFAKTMRKNAIMFTSNASHLIDNCGTGGDNSRTFNVSTCSAFVAAGAKASVAKHGNKSVSSNSGSADALNQLGINTQLSATQAKKQLEKIGITFLFAPIFHPAMKNVANVRRELGFKTVFNILGPLTNPANAKRQLIGVYDETVLQKMAKAIQLLGTEKTLLVSSDIDEISLTAPTKIFEVQKGKLKKSVLFPKQFGFEKTKLNELQAKNPRESAKKILDILKGKEGPARNIVLLNAGATIYSSGISANIKQGISLAEKSIDSGKALQKLEQMRRF
jgi:anthranilate phosphoribosyltransferase